MTNSERTNLIERSKVLNIRINDLTRLLPSPSVQDIMNEYAEEINRLDKLVYSKREYMYNFQSGGWNTEIAYTVEEAIEQAKARWVNSPNLEINEKTFHVTDEKELRSAMAMFY
jgi:flavorubredoxin